VIVNGIFELVQISGRKWSLFDYSDGKRGELIFEGSRAKAAQVCAVQSGRLPVFWYECIVNLEVKLVPVTPVQVSRIWKLTYKQMVALNTCLAESGGLGLNKWLDKEGIPA
jgi:hypothetical protein